MYYVDKTASVAGLIRDMMHGHQLVTAPHGFGKSLMMSAVDAFLNIDYRGNIWFDRLDISEEHDLDIHRNAYPVVSMDLSRVDPEDIEGSMPILVSELFLEHGCVPGPEHTLIDLCRMKSEPDGSRVFVLIDNYDRPIVDAVDEETRKKNSVFINRFLHGIVGSDFPVSVLLSGIMRMDGDSLDVFDVQYLHEPLRSRNLGFTRGDITELLKEYLYPKGIDDIFEWYGGYRCGDLELCNPSSVIQHVDSLFEIERYMPPDGKDRILHEYVIERIGRTPYRLGSDLESLMSRGWIDTCTDLGSAYPVPGVQRDTVSAMILNGYLSAVRIGSAHPGEYRVRIPNVEVYTLFSEAIEEVLDDPECCIPTIKDLANGILEERMDDDPLSMVPVITRLMNSHIFEDEETVHIFILYMNSLLKGGFIATTERLDGGERMDVVVKATVDGREVLRLAMMGGDVRPEDIWDTI